MNKLFIMLPVVFLITFGAVYFMFSANADKFICSVNDDCAFISKNNNENYDSCVNKEWAEQKNIEFSSYNTIGTWNEHIVCDCTPRSKGKLCTFSEVKTG